MARVKNAARKSAQRKATGFGSGPDKAAIARRIVNREVTLRNETPHDYVQKQRAFWDSQLRLTCPSFTHEELFAEMECPLRIITANVPTGFEFFAQCGPWALQLTKQESGRLDWQVTVWDGYTYVFHPDEARSHIVSHHSQAVYEQWRDECMIRFPACIIQLMALCRYKYPSLQLFSVTCCEKSKRLVSKIPGVHMHGEFACLIW